MIRNVIVMLSAALALALAPALYASNPIQLENAKPGSPDWMLYHSSESGEIEGYASATSVTYGEPISFYVSAIESTYTINIYRMGWYGGVGARQVLGPITRTGFRQSIPQPDPSTGLIECKWTDPYTITIPSDWTTGVYLAKLSLPESRMDSYIPFVVRDDASHANHYFQLSVDTWQAYNSWGGKSLYEKYSIGTPADKVSFDRPYTDGNGTGQFLWRWEYNMVRFLEREGYDLSYSTNIDTHVRGALLRNHRSFLSIGHDEYWSYTMRDNVEAALAAGVNLGFFTANAAYWQVRFEANSSGVANRTMVGYKEDALQRDPFALDSSTTNNKFITTQFRNTPVNRPEAALIGVQYGTDPIDGDIVIDDVTTAPWVFEGTGLTRGSVLPGLLGYEVDAIVPSTSPTNIVRLGHSFYTTTDAKHATGYSDMTVYTAARSATVFATGTIQWAWGLDDWNSGERGSRLSAPAQQITRNVLRRFADTAASVDCQFTLTPPSAEVAVEAGSASISLTTASTCSWTVSSNVPWLTVTSPASGTGSTTIQYTFSRNEGGPRTATLTIADKTYTVTQRGCAYTLTPAGSSVSSAGGTVTVTVSTDATCPWTATPQVSWITVSSASTSTGNGTVTLSVAATTGPARSGSVTIGGTSFVVDQSSGCTYTFNPTAAGLPAGGGYATVTVTASSAACPWTVTTPTSWITITDGASGTGNGTITYYVAPNSGASRDGELRINGRRYDIHQSAGSGTATFALSATATSTSTASVTWSAVSGATSYQILRGTSASSLGIVAATSGTTYSDSGLQPGQAYVYRINAVNGSTLVGASHNDATTTIAFTDATIVPGVTTIKAAHHLELRQAANMLRAAAGLTAYPFTPLGTGTVITLAHVQQLREAIDQARAALGAPPFGYGTAPASRTAVRAADIQNLRAAVQ